LKKINNDISHQNPIVKLTTKRLSKHKLTTKLSLSLEPHSIKVLQIEHINYSPVTVGRCIEAKATILGPRAVLELEDSPRARGQSSSSRTILEDPIPAIKGYSRRIIFREMTPILCVRICCIYAGISYHQMKSKILGLANV